MLHRNAERGGLLPLSNFTFFSLKMFVSAQAVWEGESHKAQLGQVNRFQGHLPAQMGQRRDPERGPGAFCTPGTPKRPAAPGQGTARTQGGRT